MAQDLSWKVTTAQICKDHTTQQASLLPLAYAHVGDGGLQCTQGPAKNWENIILGMGVAGSEPGIVGEEIAPLAKENVAAP